MDNSPVAMPYPYGWIRDQGYDNCDHDVAEFFKRAKNVKFAGRLADLSAGMEDAGDVMAKQIGGTHYKGAAVQPWDIFMQYKLDPWSANVVKYILRFPKKAGKQDLEKAKHYIEYLLANYDSVYDAYYKETA